MTDCNKKEARLLQTFDSEEEAWDAAKYQAATLKGMGLVDRYGVRVRHVPLKWGRESFWLELVDRGVRK